MTSLPTSPDTTNIPWVDDAILLLLEQYTPSLTMEEIMNWYQVIDPATLIECDQEDFMQNQYTMADAGITTMGAHSNRDNGNVTGKSVRTAANVNPIPDFSQNINSLRAESRNIGAHSRRKRVAKFTCSHCGNGFTTRFRRQTHINRYHTPEDLQVRHKCEQCSYNTTFSTDLARHMRSCSGSSK